MQHQNTQAMLTRQKIISYAKVKGLKYEETFPHSYNQFSYKQTPKEYLSDTFHYYEIGLCTRDGIWYWFRTSVFNVDDANNSLLFKQRYSQNTGNVCKAFNTGFNLELRIEKTLNK